MNESKLRSFVTIMIAVAIFSLTLRIAIEKASDMDISQNESDALETLKLISAALENYAKDNGGQFPQSLSVLTQGAPAYLKKDYTAESSGKHYVYNCPRLEQPGYSCAAVPFKCNVTGKINYTITTGGSVVTGECAKLD